MVGAAGSDTGLQEALGLERNMNLGVQGDTLVTLLNFITSPGQPVQVQSFVLLVELGDCMLVGFGYFNGIVNLMLGLGEAQGL